VPHVGLSELIVILMILLLVFGASRLPQIGESLGRTVRGFKRGMGGDEPGAAKSAHDEAATRSKLQSDSGVKSAASEISDAEVVDKKS
jgi:TatA/E family protein of Tat protein translocase